MNHAVEEPYIHDIMMEWQEYREVLPEEIPLAELHLGGGTPTFFSAKNLDRLLSELLKGTRPLPGASWSVEVHPSFTTEEQLKVLFDHGFRRLSMGVQTLNKGVQFLINRIQPFEEIKKLTEAARRIGYESINFDILYGLPNQTAEVVQNDIETLIQLRPDRVAFYGYAHVPWKHPGQRRYTEKDLPSPQERFQSVQIGKQLFQDAGYQPIGMDHFALPDEKLAVAAREGKMHRNFMGYTEMDPALLIGLGVSSISESRLGYVQNEKVIEKFREKITSDQDTFVNGHSFTQEELHTREGILEVMCRMRLSESFYEDESVLEGLKEMERDGLVEFKEDYMVVLEEGRPFLRSICALIDPMMTMSNEERYSSNL